MKKFTAFILAVLMVSALTACGSGAAAPTVTTQAMLPAAEPMTPYTVQPIQSTDPLVLAEAQGIAITSGFIQNTESENTYTYYTVEYDDTVEMLSSPSDRADIIGEVTLPFNGHLIGTCGDWWLTDDLNGRYFYIYAPAVGRVATDSSIAPSDYSAILTLAAENGTVAPEGFRVEKGQSGKLINDSGTVYYAVYKCHDPTVAAHYGSFYLVNTSNSKTTGYDSRITKYGDYGDFTLVCHEGEFFWCGTHYFKANRE